MHSSCGTLYESFLIEDFYVRIFLFIPLRNGCYSLVNHLEDNRRSQVGNIDSRLTRRRVARFRHDPATLNASIGGFPLDINNQNIKNVF